mmetsp:Transcript_117384/g.328588  ORF Transcript_117384/g.328588 Transcript_117384/m.328588 type:complete len:326 (-) Transcript_117384:454-1431(-)
MLGCRGPRGELHAGWQNPGGDDDAFRGRARLRHRHPRAHPLVAVPRPAGRLSMLRRVKHLHRMGARSAALDGATASARLRLLLARASAPAGRAPPLLLAGAVASAPPLLLARAIARAALLLLARATALLRAAALLRFGGVGGLQRLHGHHVDHVRRHRHRRVFLGLCPSLRSVRVREDGPRLPDGLRLPRAEEASAAVEHRRVLVGAPPETVARADAIPTLGCRLQPPPAAGGKQPAMVSRAGIGMPVHRHALDEATLLHLVLAIQGGPLFVLHAEDRRAHVRPLLIHGLHRRARAAPHGDGEGLREAGPLHAEHPGRRGDHGRA